MDFRGLNTLTIGDFQASYSGQGGDSVVVVLSLIFGWRGRPAAWREM